MNEHDAGREQPSHVSFREQNISFPLNAAEVTPTKQNCLPAVTEADIILTTCSHVKA